MSDMKFFMANVVLIVGLAIGFGQYGLADMLDEDVDISPGGEDFDTDRLQFQIDSDFIEERRDTMLVWSGEEGPDEEEYGSILYSLAGEEDDRINSVAIEVDSARFASNSDIEVWGSRDDPDNEDGIIIEFITRLSDGETVIDNLDSREETEYTTITLRNYDDTGDQGIVEVQSVQVQGDTVSIDDRDQGLDLRINEVPRDVDDEGFFASATSTLQTTFNAISSVGQFIGAWFSFIWAIPGLIGSAFRMYITGFFVYFLVVYIWIG